MVGGGPSGTTTTTQNNIPWNSGNLSQIQNQATYLMGADPYQYYPNQTLAAPNQLTVGGLQNAGNYSTSAGDASAPLTPEAQAAALNANTSLAGGAGVSAAMPWLNALTQAGQAGNPAQPSIDALFGVGTGEAAQDLAKTGSGYYLSNQNPYLASMYQASADPVTRNFMAATAPGTDSAMERAGRFNSGATANAQSNNQQALGDTLGNLSSTLYGNAYNAERSRQDSAAAQLGALQSGVYSNAGSLGVSGANSQNAANSTALNAWNQLLAGQQNSINATPALSGMYAQDYQSAINAGNQLQQLDQAGINDQISRFFGVQQAPWNTASQAANIVGGAIPGLSTTTQPYFSPSPLAQIASIGASGAGIAKSLAK